MNFGRLQKVYKTFGMSILNDVKVWQFLELHEEIWEWDNKRIWKFKCLVLKTWNKSHPDWTFTIRWVSTWNTIEKVYPFSYGKFKKIILLDEYKIRKSKLYYIREKLGKSARFKSKITSERRWIDLLKPIS